MKHLVLICGFCFLGNLLSAQKSLDILTLSGRYGFPASYEAPFENHKGTETGALVNIQLALPTKGSTRWYNNLTYTTFHVNNDAEMNADVANPIHLHSFILQTGLYHKFENGNGILLLFAPRFMTDFENASGKNFQPGVMFLYEKKFHDDLLLRFGALYHDELGGPYLVPIVLSDWQINSKWSLNGMWPIYGKLNYHVSDNFTTGISHFGLVTSYRLGNPSYEGDYIERTSIDLTLFGRIRLAGNLHLEGRFGYALGRSYEQYSSDQKVPFRITIIKFGDNRVAKNTLFNPGPIINLRLAYNLPL
jgi:hypothetical protein